MEKIIMCTQALTAMFSWEKKEIDQSTFLAWYNSSWCSVILTLWSQNFRKGTTEDISHMHVHYLYLKSKIVLILTILEIKQFWICQAEYWETIWKSQVTDKLAKYHNVAENTKSKGGERLRRALLSLRS